MIKAYFGAYHSGLERCFLSSLQSSVQNRTSELEQKIVIAVPSTYLKQYLIKQFFTSTMSSLVNVHFLTLDGFARNVFSDVSKTFHLIDNNVFYAKLLQERLKNVSNKFFQYISKSYGASAALYNSIRDLYDANLLPNEFNELVEFIESEDIVDDRGNGYTHKDIALLENVAKSYEIFYNVLQDKNIVNNPKLLQIAADNVFNSSFLDNVKSIFWYGFYDATQTQFNFIENTTRKVMQNKGDIYFFSPIDVQHGNVIDECKYARLFYQDLIILINSLGKDNILEYLPVQNGAVSGGVEYYILKESDNIPKISDDNISIWSCAGYYEEVLSCAKEILRLVNTGQYAFDEIAVVARTIEPYSFYIDTIFQDNNIPYQGALQYNNSEFNPFFRFMLNIFYAYLYNLQTSFVLEIISDKRFKWSGDVNIQNIKYILDTFYIKTKEDWVRLKSLYSEFDSVLVTKFAREQLSREKIRAVIVVLDRLDSILSGLSGRGKICDIANNFFDLLKREFVLQRQDIECMEKLRVKLVAFNYLDGIYDLEEFTHIFEETIKNINNHNRGNNGVFVLDVMKFRGLSSKIVFILGMNKDVFPREVSEEPFISDSIRKKIDYFAGAKIKQKRKLAIKEMGYDEEFILFYHTLKSATDKIYLIYQRADAKGNLLSPSYYLERINYLLGERQKDIPKDIMGKYNYYGGINGFIPSKNELSILLSLSDNALSIFPSWFEKQYGIRDKQSYIKTVMDFAEKINGRNACFDVDGFLMEKSNQLIDYLKNEDGKIELSQKGLSTYKKCPFMFFAERILKVEEVDEEEKEEFVSVLHLGNITDITLKYYFQKKELFEGKVDNDILNKSLLYARKVYKNFLNPLQLDYALGKVKTAITNFLSDATYKGWKVTIPKEEEMKKDIDIKDVVLTGIPDAIFTKDNITRIVDFKFGSIKKYSQSEGPLYGSGLLQFIVYPIVYPEDIIDSPIEFKYENLAVYLKYVNMSFLKQVMVKNQFTRNIIDNKQFLDTFGRVSEYEDIEEYYEKLKKDVVEGILSSFFIIHENSAEISPYSVCNYCNFFLICRRNHPETQSRILTKWKQMKTQILNPVK